MDGWNIAQWNLLWMLAVTIFALPTLSVLCLDHEVVEKVRQDRPNHLKGTQVGEEDFQWTN